MRSLIVQVYDKCLIKCPGCYNYNTRGVCSSQELIDFIEKVKISLGLRKVTISGGEPLMRTDIISLVEQIKKMNLYINLDTLGLPFASKEILENTRIEHIDISGIIKNVDMIGIPLDGSTTEIIRKFRSGITIEQMYSVLDNAEKKEANICINTVVHQGNIKDIKNIYHIILNYKCIKKWQIFEYMPIGPNGFLNKNRYMLDENGIETVKSIISDFETEKEIQFKSNEMRKNNYILVDSSGVVWMPKSTKEKEWQVSDINNQRIVIGKIQEKNIVEKLIEGEWI